MVLRLVAPPVAVAQYLRAVYAPTRPQITYVGGCPAGADDAIDECLAPEALLLLLADRGIDPTAQPTEFDSVLPPDRRRFFSDPGGVPSRSALAGLGTPVELVEARGDDVIVEIAQQLLSSSRTLIDVAPALGCCCSGMYGSVGAEGARARVREQEPPRAPTAVLDHSLRLELDVASSPQFMTGAVSTLGAPDPRPVEVTPLVESVPVEGTPRRRSPPGMQRAVLGATPLRRSEAGRQLPRAFVARRRSSPRSGVRQSFMRAAIRTRPSARSRQVWIAGAVGLAMTGAVIALVIWLSR